MVLNVPFASLLPEGLLPPKRVINLPSRENLSFSILKFSRDGKFITRFGGSSPSGKSEAKGTFNTIPRGIAVDGRGYVFVSLVSNVLVFDTNGAYIDSFKTM